MRGRLVHLSVFRFVQICIVVADIRVRGVGVVFPGILRIVFLDVWLLVQIQR